MRKTKDRVKENVVENLYSLIEALKKDDVYVAVLNTKFISDDFIEVILQYYTPPKSKEVKEIKISNMAEIDIVPYQEKYVKIVAMRKFLSKEEIIKKFGVLTWQYYGSMGTLNETYMMRIIELDVIYIKTRGRSEKRIRVGEFMTHEAFEDLVAEMKNAGRCLLEAHKLATTNSASPIKTVKI